LHPAHNGTAGIVDLWPFVSAGFSHQCLLQAKALVASNIKPGCSGTTRTKGWTHEELYHNCDCHISDFFGLRFSLGRPRSAYALNRVAPVQAFYFDANAVFGHTLRKP